MWREQSVTLYLSGHWREVPHVDHNGPAGHHPQQVADHVVFTAVPERITEARVVLRHRADCRSDTVTHCCVILTHISSSVVLKTNRLYNNWIKKKILNKVYGRN